MKKRTKIGLIVGAAAVLGALTGVDPRDPATQGSAGHFHTDYTQFLDPDGLNGARIGVMRSGVTGYSQSTDAVFEQALEAMADAGAVLVDPADLPTMDELLTDQSEIIVLIWEFKRDLNAYLATRTGVPVQTLAGVIEFNLEHASQELQYFGQEFFQLAQGEIFTEQEYLEALERGPRLAGLEGIDAVLQQLDLDALVAPTGSPAWPIDLVNGDPFLGASSFPAAMAGYPIINIISSEEDSGVLTEAFQTVSSLALSLEPNVDYRLNLRYREIELLTPARQRACPRPGRPAR